MFKIKKRLTSLYIPEDVDQFAEKMDIKTTVLVRIAIRELLNKPELTIKAIIAEYASHKV